ncbi:MAG TPA: hypothetical protein VN783_13240 [Thermoanaerobaculia bacterium]|nr:hypothetical protein [Thermoanaerobaculia bacterium]
MTCRAVLPDLRVRRPLAFFLVAWLVGPAALPAAVAVPVQPVPVLCGVGANLPNPPVDNRDGYFVNLEEAPLRPLAFGSDGHTLFALNLPDAKVVVFDTTNPLAPVSTGEIGVGLGPVSIVLRPAAALGDARELWVACQSSNSVFVIDEATRRVKDSVRLKAEPTGIAFDATGQFAYVTLAATNRIAKITASAPHSTDPIASGFEFQSETRPGAALAHVEEPRALLVEGDDLYALSFQSSNASMPGEHSIINVLILDGWQASAANVPPVLPLPVPPDRDVLRFNLGNPGSAGINALWRMGTLNFDLARGGPQNDLYVSTVDLTNATFDLHNADPTVPSVPVRLGEPQYRKDGFAIHAVTHAAPGTGAPNQPPARIDLNVNVDPALISAGYHCAVPNQIAITPDNQRMFVACYETRNVAVVDLASDTVIAVLQGGTGATDPFGPRGLALAGNTLYVYARGDQKLQVYDVSGLTPGTVRPPVAAATRLIGYDITSQRILNGRRHFLNAANSLSKVATCNTCHMDGHLDGIAWNLSDFTGFDDQVGRVPKGTKVTMSLRGIEETPPFHWRGDRADLKNFNPAFAGLLGGSQLTVTDDPLDDDQLAEFESFVFGLSYPANPVLPDDRVYSQTGKEGFDCFTGHPTTHTVSSDSASATIQLSCEKCHSMAGASGTLNQVNNPVTGLLADDATQLRGTFDKESDTVAFGSFPSGSPFEFFNKIPASGWGFANTSFTNTLQDFVDLGVFSFPQGAVDKAKVTTFLREFDTGIAPAAAFAYTVTAASAPEETLLTGQVGTRPNIDLILRGWIQIAPGNEVPFGALWNGTQFLTDRAAIAPLTLANLHTRTAAGTGKFTLIGTPVGSGYRLSIDRDMDFRLDGDEALAPATSTANPDTDNDRYPDGYEIRLGSNPANPLSKPLDAVNPVVTSGAVAWTNASVMKVRWTTDEESKSRLQIFRVPAGGGAAVFVREFQEKKFKKKHVLVARELKPGETYRPVLIAEDPSGNTGSKTLPDQAIPSPLFKSVHSSDVAKPTLVRNGPGTSPGTQNYTATLTLVDENGAPVGGASVVLKLVEWASGTCTTGCNTETIIDIPTATSNPTTGVVTLTFDGTRVFSSGTAEVFVTPISTPAPKQGITDPAGKKLYFHSLDGQFGHWAQTPVP